MLKKIALIAALSAFAACGVSVPDSAQAAQKKPVAASTKAPKVHRTAGQCRARCDFLYFSGKDRSKCYTNVCSRFPE